MKSARNQLILLGFICQGLSWDDYFMPLLTVVLWACCLRFASRKIQLGPAIEIGLLLGGCVASYTVGLAMGINVHFFLGHGLTLLQAARLLRPLNQREKFFSILIAFFHLAVACSFVFDLRFILIFLAAVILIPKTFAEFASDSFPMMPAGMVRPSPWKLRLPACGIIVLCAILFFLCFPRVFLGAHLPSRQSAESDQGNMLDSLMDPTSGALEGSSQTLLQIEGENIGYLRCFSLIDFDGVQWSAPVRAPLKRIAYVPGTRTNTHQYRRVRVKNANYLSHVLPTDGQVANLSGNFFWRPAQNNHGGIICDAMWNTANNFYAYWNIPTSGIEQLFRSQVVAYTKYPPQSDRLRSWLDATIEGIDDPLAQARKLESYFRGHFTYQLGAPKLSRLNPTEDFLFNQRTGHCERFASTLTLLLRMRNIPSRVVIGYAPTSRNLSSTGYNIRFKDAHAWTEAWFQNVGWVQLDATPRSSMISDRWSVREVFEDLDLAWSSYIVNFDAPMQSQLLNEAVRVGSNILVWMRHNFLVWLGFVMMSVMFLFWRSRQNRALSSGNASAAREQTRILAQQYYAEMLMALARQGLRRGPDQTPFEFLRAIQPVIPSVASQVETITSLFCDARYGNHILTKTQKASITEALSLIKAMP